MASRRLNSDRFFTDSFTDDVYTPEGMTWIADNTMRTLLARHCPDLSRRWRSCRTRSRYGTGRPRQ